MDERLIAARCEACAWLAEHPEIPWVTVEGCDGELWVTLGTRTLHVVAQIPGAAVARAKLDRARDALGL